MNELFLEEHLKADMSRSCYVGETAAEHRVFVEMVTMGRASDMGDYSALGPTNTADSPLLLRPLPCLQVMGRVDTSLNPVPPDEQRHADIALLDENLHDGVTGSSLAAELKDAGFRGITCILTGSANDAIADLQSSAAVDFAAPKGVSFPSLAKHLRRLAAARRWETAPAASFEEVARQHVDLQRVSSTVSSRGSSKTASRQGSRVTSPLNTPPSTPIFAQSSPPRLTERLPAAATPPPPPLSAEAAADRTPPASPYGT